MNLHGQSSPSSLSNDGSMPDNSFHVRRPFKLKVFRNFIISLVIVSAFGCGGETFYRPVNGDIVFHTSRSSQSKAIQEATHSPYSHMGIVYVRGGEAFVFEAIEPVGLTPLNDWIARGEREAFVVKRLRDSASVLTPVDSQIILNTKV
jgi:hypothetical protein